MMYEIYDNDQLLHELDQTRRSWMSGTTDADITAREAVMLRMATELVSRNVYPRVTVEGNPNDVWVMVKSYGAHWNRWAEPLSCPSCHADLRDHRTGPPYKREIGLYDRGRDQTSGWYCPECKANVHQPLPHLAESS